ADDPDPWARQLAAEAGAAVLAVAPVIVREGLLGLLVANWPSGSAATVDQAQVVRGLTGLADHAGVALLGVRSEEERERRTSFDPVTLLADQAMFHDRLTLHLGDRRRAA